MILGFVALGGLGWEFYEFLCDKFIAQNGFMETSQISLIDTMTDLFFDLVGGFAVALTFLYKFKKDTIKD